MGSPIEIDAACEAVVRSVLGHLVDDDDPDAVPPLSDSACSSLSALLTRFEGQALVMALKTLSELAFYVFEELGSEVNGHKLLGIVARALPLVPAELQPKSMRFPSDGGFGAFMGGSPATAPTAAPAAGGVKAGPLARHSLRGETVPDVD